MHSFGIGFVSPQVLDLGAGTATVTGTAKAGQLQTCTYNFDDPDGGETGLSYQWQWADTIPPTPIGGATASTYMAKSSDSDGNHTLNCKVTYTDANGHLTTITSSTTGTIAAADLSITYQGQSDLASSTSTTPQVLSFPIGTAASDRFVIVHWYAPSTSALPADLKINGVSAVPLVGVAVNPIHSSLWALLVPAGSTCDIQGVYDRAPNNVNSFQVWTLTGSGGVSIVMPDSTNAVKSTGSSTYTFTTKARGVVIGTLSYQSGSTQTVTTDSGWSVDGSRAVGTSRFWSGHWKPTGVTATYTSSAFSGNRGILGCYLEAA